MSERRSGVCEACGGDDWGEEVEVYTISAGISAREKRLCVRCALKQVFDHLVQLRRATSRLDIDLRSVARAVKRGSDD